MLGRRLGIVAQDRYRLQTKSERLFADVNRDSTPLRNESRPPNEDLIGARRDRRDPQKPVSRDLAKAHALPENLAARWRFDRESSNRGQGWNK